MIRASKAVLGLGLALLVSPTLSAQIPDGFEVVRLTDPAINSRPSINNSSDVMWEKAFPPSASKVFLFRNGIIHEITNDTVYAVKPFINNNGDFGYFACDNFFDPFDLIFNPGGGQAMTVATGIVDMWPDINDEGRIVWTHDEGALDANSSVFYYDRNMVSEITSNGLSNQNPCISNSGEIFFVTKNLDAPGDPSTIFRWFKGALTPLTDNDKERSTPHCNDTGQVIWIEDGGVGKDDVLIIWQDGKTTTLVDGVELGTLPTINNHGDVALGVWNPEKGFAETRLYKSDKQTFYVMPDFGLSAGAGTVNDRRELVWRAVSFVTGETSLFLLRRAAPLGDFGHDCHIDLYDYAIFEGCFTGADGGPGNGLLADCTRADFDNDGDVDWQDASAFVDTMTGPGTEVLLCKP